MDFLSNIIGRKLGGWTTLALVLGLGIVAACLLIPAVEENRELRWEVARLRAEKARVDEQIAANQRFIEQVSTDPTLLSRLVQRQFQLRPAGTQTLEIPGVTEPRSPFQLATVPPPETAAPFEPMGGSFLLLFREGRARLYLMGLAFIMMATGLVLDGGRATQGRQAQAFVPEEVPAPIVQTPLHQPELELGPAIVAA